MSELEVSRAYECLAAPRSSNPRTRAAWLEQRGRIRAALRYALALDALPDRLPLNAREQTDPAGDAGVPRRIAFDVWPGVPATGWLSLPGGTAQPAPLVLRIAAEPWKPWRAGELADSAGLAERGFAVLVVDGWEVDRPELALSTAGLLAAAHLRALDFAAARPELDESRVALLAAGAGSDLAALLCAVDDCPACAAFDAPAGYLRDTLAAAPALVSRLLPPGVLRVTDRGELYSMLAPKPLWLAPQGDGDAADPAAAALGEILGVYGLFALQERVVFGEGGARAKGGVDAWLAQQLAQAGEGRKPPRAGHREVPASPAPASPPPDAAFLVPQEGDREAALVAHFRETIPAQPPRLESRPARKQYQARLREGLRELLEETDGEVALEPTEQAGAAGGPWSGTLQPAAGVRIPYRLALPGDAPAAVVLYLVPAGAETGSDAAAFERAALAGGLGCLALGSRLALEQDAGWQALLHAAGRTAAAMAARDVIAAVDYLTRRKDVDRRRIALVGSGAAGVAALLAAGWDERIAAVAADCGATTYRDGGEGLPRLPGILRLADLPQLASLAAPRPLRLTRVPGERTGFSSRRYYDWTRRTYQSLGADEALRMDVDAAPRAAELAAWIAAALRKR